MRANVDFSTDDCVKFSRGDRDETLTVKTCEFVPPLLIWRKYMVIDSDCENDQLIPAFVSVQTGAVSTERYEVSERTVGVVPHDAYEANGPETSSLQRDQVRVNEQGPNRCGDAILTSLHDT